MCSRFQLSWLLLQFSSEAFIVPISYLSWTDQPLLRDQPSTGRSDRLKSEDMITCCLVRAITYLARRWHTSMEQRWSVEQQEKTEKLAEKPVSVPLSPSRMPPDVTRNWTRVCASRRQHTTAWPPSKHTTLSICYYCLTCVCVCVWNWILLINRWT
jgi:hypothetical protein